MKPVQLWPTPHAADATGGGSPIRHDPETADLGGRSNLRDWVRIWPTPIARDYKDGTAPGSVPVNAILGRAVNPSPSDGRLNPEFVEWLMGFEIGYTDLSKNGD